MAGEVTLLKKWGQLPLNPSWPGSAGPPRQRSSSCSRACHSTAVRFAQRTEFGIVGSAQYRPDWVARPSRAMTACWMFFCWATPRSQGTTFVVFQRR